MEHLVDGALAHALSFVSLALSTAPATWRITTGRALPPFRGGLVLAVVGAGLLLTAGTGGMAGRVDVDAIGTVLSETAYGRAWVGCAVLLVATALVRRLTWVVALGALSCLALLGHDSGRLLRVVHLACGVAWLGGLLAAIAAPEPGALRRFSPFAAGLLGGAIVTGAVLVRDDLGGLAHAYVRVLLAKLSALAVAMIVAYGHRRRIAGGGALDRALGNETLAVLCVVALAGLLGQVPPPR